jgi:hypothetical protein
MASGRQVSRRAEIPARHRRAARHGPLSELCGVRGGCSAVYPWTRSDQSTPSYPCTQKRVGAEASGEGTPAPPDLKEIIAAINAGFTINLSADNTAHADKLAELGIAPVVTVLARAYARRAARRRLKWWPDQWAETIGEWRDRTFS